MYDSICLYLEKKEIGDSYKWDKVLKRIYQTCEYKTIPGECGYLDNLRISVTEKRIVCVGSFAKFQNGNNIVPLTMKQVQGIIKTLTMKLGVPMHKADVMSIDVAENFVMEKSPQLYIDKIKTLYSFVSNNWGNTKYFSSKNTTLCFYDKGKEICRRSNPNRKQKTLLLAECKEKNLLRYEARFKKGKIRRMFGHGLKAEDLYKKDIYWKFIAEWLGCYDDIYKSSNSTLNINYHQIRKQEDFLNWCICTLNTYIPVSEFVKLKFQNRENPKKSDRQYHQRNQKKIRKALNHNQDYIIESDLIQELTKKIEDFLTEKFENSPDAYDKD